MKKIEMEKIKKHVDGDLDLSHSEIESLPEGLRVDGNLDLSYSVIGNLPRNLIVVGDLCLKNSNISSLPEGLVVGGVLDIRGTNIHTFQEKISVKKICLDPNQLSNQELDKIHQMYLSNPYMLLVL